MITYFNGLGDKEFWQANPAETIFCIIIIISFWSTTYGYYLLYHVFACKIWWSLLVFCFRDDSDTETIDGEGRYMY